MSVTGVDSSSGSQMLSGSTGDKKYILRQTTRVDMCNEANRVTSQLWPNQLMTTARADALCECQSERKRNETQ